MRRYRTDARGGWRVLGGSSRSQAALMTLEAGERTGGPDNRHPASDQWLLVLAGGGEAVVEGEPVRLERGDLLHLEAGEAHEIRAGPEGLHTVNVYAPPEF